MSEKVESPLIAFQMLHFLCRDLLLPKKRKQVNWYNTCFAICLHDFKKTCLGPLATEFPMCIVAEPLLCFQPANTATQYIKILVLTQLLLGETVLGLANYPLAWIRKNCLSVQTPDPIWEHIDGFIWMSSSFLHFN